MLFGWSTPDVDGICNRVAEALGEDFERHESSYLGWYFLAGLPGSEHFEIRANQDEEGELAEPDFPWYLVLLYVNETNRPDEIVAALSKLPDAVQLRSEELPC